MHQYTNQHNDSIRCISDHEFHLEMLEPEGAFAKQATKKTLHRTLREAKLHCKAIRKRDYSDTKRLVWKKVDVIATPVKKMEAVATPKKKKITTGKLKKSKETFPLHVTLTHEIMLDLKFIKMKSKFMYKWKYDSDFPEFTVNISHITHLHDLFEFMMWEIWNYSKELGQKEFVIDFKERFNLS